MRNFREMIIWNQGIDLAIKVYQLTKKLPREELYGLSSQLTKAAVSIPSNIAEGCSRSSERDFARFLEIALGSAYEVETQLIIAEKIGYLEGGLISELIENLGIEERQIHSLLNRIRPNLH